MLLVKAKGGLGNRMLSAASAIVYAQASNREWCLDWSDGVYARDKINAVPLLFPSLQQHVFSPENWRSKHVVPSVWRDRLGSSISEVISKDYPGEHSNPLIYRRLSAPFKSAGIHNGVEVFWSYTSKYGRIKRFLTPEQKRLGRDHVLGDALRTNFLPNSVVAETVNRLIVGDGASVLGVHIRYTDLKIPIDKLMICVKAQMRKFNYDSIFLASDSLDAEVRFKREFKNVITSEKQYPKNNTQLHAVRQDDNSLQGDSSLDGATSALVDMFALSKCAGLVYCSRSTFAETSRLIGAIPPKRVTDVDNYNVVIRLKRILQEYL